jgi:hypothetical protein
MKQNESDKKKRGEKTKHKQTNKQKQTKTDRPRTLASLPSALEFKFIPLT